MVDRDKIKKSNLKSDTVISGPEHKSDSQPHIDQHHPGSSQQEIAEFVAQTKALPPTTASGLGHLLFAMDATMSRQATWDMALSLQGEMFDAVGSIGNLAVQLIYFRALNECRASKWVSDPGQLSTLMTKVVCRGGRTQIRKVLAHGVAETMKIAEGGNEKINAIVYVGDAMEEDIDGLCQRAGELKCHGVPVFMFHEGDNRVAARAFKEIARITGGAYCPFDSGAARQLAELLSAVAAYAAGGRGAVALLGEKGNRSAPYLLQQISS